MYATRRASKGHRRVRGMNLYMFFFKPTVGLTGAVTFAPVSANSFVEAIQAHECTSASTMAEFKTGELIAVVQIKPRDPVARDFAKKIAEAVNVGDWFFQGDGEDDDEPPPAR